MSLPSFSPVSPVVSSVSRSSLSSRPARFLANGFMPASLRAGLDAGSSEAASWAPASRLAPPPSLLSTAPSTEPASLRPLAAAARTPLGGAPCDDRTAPADCTVSPPPSTRAPTCCGNRSGDSPDGLATGVTVRCRGGILARVNRCVGPPFRSCLVCRVAVEDVFYCTQPFATQCQAPTRERAAETTVCFFSFHQLLAKCRAGRGNGRRWAP